MPNIGRQAAFAAWLLRVSPEEVFPHGVECTQEADEHLAFCMRQKVDELLGEAQRSKDRSAEAVRYIDMLLCADRVLDGAEEVPEGEWNENRIRFRRGPYVFVVGTACGPEANR